MEVEQKFVSIGFFKLDIAIYYKKKVVSVMCPQSW